MTGARRVLLIDDHALVGETLAILLRQGGTVSRYLHPDRFDIASVERFAPHLVLLDMSFGSDDRGGLQILPVLADRSYRIAVLSGSDDRRILGQAILAGASAVLNKALGLDAVVEAVERLLRGEALLSAVEREQWRNEAEPPTIRSGLDSLSARERAVFAHLTQGRKAAEIAALECVSLATVRTQIRAILQKLGVQSQLAAVALARSAMSRAR